MKICIGIPCNRQFKAKTVLSLMEMVSTKMDYHFAIATEGYTVAENRNWIVAQAIKNDCTHLLLTDDDMIYGKDTLKRLLAREKDIIGVNYSVRRIVDKDTNHLVIEYLDEKSDTELFKCKAIGGGMLLINMKVFEKIEQKWFWYDVHPNGMILMSNDWWFCRQARRAGYDIWCDSTIKVGHIGNYEY